MSRIRPALAVMAFVWLALFGLGVAMVWSQWPADGAPTMHIVINGDELPEAWFDALAPAQQTLLAGLVLVVAMLGMLASLLVLPLMLLGLALGLGAALLAGVGLPMLLLGLLLAPLWLLAWALWRALRPARGSARIAA